LVVVISVASTFYEMSVNLREFAKSASPNSVEITYKFYVDHNACNMPQNRHDDFSFTATIHLVHNFSEPVTSNFQVLPRERCCGCWLPSDQL
jgi:hypothetical protein